MTRVFDTVIAVLRSYHPGMYSYIFLYDRVSDERGIHGDTKMVTELLQTGKPPTALPTSFRTVPSSG